MRLWAGRSGQRLSNVWASNGTTFAHDQFYLGYESRDVLVHIHDGRARPLVCLPRGLQFVSQSVVADSKFLSVVRPTNSAQQTSLVLFSLN